MYKPWKEAHKLFRAQCGTDEDMDPMVSRVAEMSIYVANGKYNLQQQNNLKSGRTIYISSKLGKRKLKCIFYFTLIFDNNVRPEKI